MFIVQRGGASVLFERTEAVSCDRKRISKLFIVLIFIELMLNIVGCGEQNYLECADEIKFEHTTFLDKNSRLFHVISWVSTSSNDKKTKGYRTYLSPPDDSVYKGLCQELGSSFGTSLSIQAVANGPIDMVVADFNGDDKPDAAFANEISNNVSIYLGKTDVSFEEPVLFDTGIRPQRIQVGDFNNDGKTDLVTANAGDPFVGSGDVSLLLGDGSGGFAAPESISMGKLPFDVAVADFNRDAKLDLAVADYDYETQTIALRLGNGDGSFLPVQTFSVPELAQSLAVADLNGDQNPDLVSNGAVLLGNGAGGFSPASRFPLGAPPYLVRVGDLNADTKPDVVLASGGSNIISVLINQGDGSLAAPRYYVTGNNPAEVSIVDLNDDGKTDLLVSNSHDDHLTLLYGKEDGYFTGLPTYPSTDGTGTSWEHSIA